MALFSIQLVFLLTDQKNSTLQQSLVKFAAFWEISLVNCYTGLESTCKKLCSYNVSELLHQSKYRFGEIAT